MNKLKVIGLIGTGLGLVATVIDKVTSDKAMNEKIAEQVQKALSEKK